MAATERRGAFVLFEGLPATVIDSQVLTHVRLAREKLGFDFSVIAFTHGDALYRASSARLERARQIAGGRVELVRGVRPMVPGSTLFNRRLLDQRIEALVGALGPISLIHARTDYAAAVAGALARRRGIAMLWDCRGDSAAELQVRMDAKSAFVAPLAAARRALLRRERAIAGETCKAACFVSKPLHDLMRTYLGEKPSWVIPCLAAEEEFFVSGGLREKQRAKLGIGAEEIVYIYSGGLAGYQLFGETIAVFGRICAERGNARLIVLTPEIEKAQGMAADLPRDRVICKSVPNSEVNAYLNAADFGFLLRAPTAVNRVAFPTKFAEYCLAGLKVIMKNDPPSCVEVAKGLGNYVATDEADAVGWSVNERMRCGQAAIALLGRQARMQTYGEIYAMLSGTSQTARRPAA